jgi:dTDP-glucose 4,6-dehydratase
MKILVTGGKGVVGTLLVEELRKQGHHVIACDLFHECDQIGFTVGTDVPDAGYVRCDVGEYRQLQRLFDRLGPFDYVYHAAAEFGRWNGEDYYENLWKSNAVGTKHVIRLQEQLRFRLIHFSSSEVYGDWPELMIESVMDEHEIKQMNDYAMTKWVNEMQIRNSAQSQGTETVVVRLFNTYGPGEHYSPYRSVNCRFVYCALRGLPWTVFRGHSRTSTYLTDTVRTLSRIVGNFKPGETYNIAGRTLHSIETLSDTILKVTGADPGLVRYRDSESLTTGSKIVNAEKAVRDLGHQDTCTLEEGIQRTVQWMREIYKIP